MGLSHSLPSIIAMLVTRLHRFFAAPATKASSPQVIFWFSLSLAFTIFYGILAAQKAFSSEYVVQYDARVYVYWMQRFADPALMPHDLIADYYQSVTPSGYATLFRLMAAIGIQPLLLTKLLPVVLGLFTAGYCFAFCMQILPIPAAGFISSLLLNQSLWMQDEMIAANPRSFVYPLFLAFLYYLSRRSLLPCLMAIALQGVFYPPFLLIIAGVLILRLWRWKIKLPQFDRRSDYLFCAAGLGVALLVMLPYALSSSKFGPIVTVSEAKTWPEFMANGKIPFFTNNPWKYWLSDNHSGIRLSLNPPLVGAAFLLPILLRYPSRFPLAKQVKSEVILLLQILLASLGCFFAAHAVLFKLFLPGRYTVHTLRMLMALAAGIALTVILDAIWQWGIRTKTHLQRQQIRSLRLRQVLVLASTALIWTTIVFYPNLFWQKYFPTTLSYIVGGVPSLYQFFQGQPKDIHIASLTAEADDVPIFSQRSIIVSRMYADPYDVGYYRQIRQRATDLIRAQYSQDLAEVQTILRKYKVDFWLLERTAFTPDYVAKNHWLQQYQPAATEAVDSLKRGTPILSKLMKTCSVFEINDFVVLKAGCISKASVK